jgi:hypothetical protein
MELCDFGYEGILRNQLVGMDSTSTSTLSVHSNIGMVLVWVFGGF